jgi:hypothetical protein
MKPMLHLIKWDVKRFRVLLAVWLLVVAASAALEGAWPGVAVAMAARQTVGITGNLLALAEVLFSIVFIALVVQEHPLVGTTAFWMTRPIPPRRLLAAKLIFLFAAVVLAPVIAEIILMILYTVPPREIAAVSLQTAMFWTLWLTIVMTFAALTANIAKFSLAVGGVIISMIVSIVILAAIAFDRAGEEPPIPTAQGPYDPTSGIILTVLLVSAALVLLVVLYRTRARPGAVAVGIAGVVLATAISDAWPWPWLAPQIETPAWASEPAVLQLSMSPGDIDVRDGGQHFGDTPTEWKIARARMRLIGLEPGWSAGVGLRESSIRVSGREALTSRVRARGASVAIGEAENARQNDTVRRVLNVNHLVDYESPQRPESAIVMVARIPELRQLGVDRAGYVGAFQVSLTRHDVEAVLPFRAGASLHLGAYRFALDRVTPYESRISLLARESAARSVFDRRPRSRLNYYLRNPNTSEAVHGSRRDLRTDSSLLSLLPFTVGVGVDNGDSGGFNAHAVEVNFPSSDGDQRPVVFDETWLERGELVIVRSTEGGSVERRIAMEDFPIPAK